jgi:acyl-CoA thioesterase FadM
MLDVARMDLLARAGLIPELKQRGWFPVATGESIGFRRALTAFQRFEVETRVLGWDERSLHIDQRFIRNEEEVASVLVVGRFLRATGGSVTPEEVAELAGVSESPEVPEWAVRLGADQERLRLGRLAD